MLDIIKDIGEEATTNVIKDRIIQKHPERTLNQHFRRRLDSLEQNGLVKKEQEENLTKWKLTERGHTEASETSRLNNIDCDCSQKDLKNIGVEIQNIVCTFNTGNRFDLYNIESNLERSEYHPETDSYLNYRPVGDDFACLRLPSTGRITVTGGQTKQQIINTIKKFDKETPSHDFDLDISADNIEIQNLVATFSLERELDIVRVAEDYDQMSVGGESPTFVKYSPDLQGCAMLYRTGKVTIVGTRTYPQIKNFHTKLCNMLKI